MKYLMILLILISPVYGKDVLKQFSQLDDKIRKWLKDQTIPGSNQRCCDENDGVRAEEDIRGDEIWVRFSVCRTKDDCDDVDWRKVPKEAIIEGPNLYGAPVVWHSTSYGVGNVKTYNIRCFIPGPRT